MDIGPFLLLMLLYAKLDGTTVDPSPLRSSKQGFLPYIRNRNRPRTLPTGVPPRPSHERLPRADHRFFGQ